MSNIFSKFAKFVPKKVAVVFATVAAILVPAAIFAVQGPSRPTFTMEQPASYVTFNSITDNTTKWAVINGGVTADERDFVLAKNVSGGAYSDNVTVANGAVYNVIMYVHNNAATQMGLDAENVTAFANFPTSEGTSKTLQGNIFATNATPQQVYDDVTFTNANGFTLSYVAGSAKYINEVGTFGLPDSLVNGSGATLGYTSMNGDIPGCLHYSGYIQFQVRANVNQPQNPSYDVTKTVTPTGAVKPGDTLTYTITAKNTGNVDLTNVKINDTLPAYFASARENISAPSSISGSIVNGGSVTIAKLPVGGTATITITYVVKSADNLPCGNTSITNTVTSSTDQTSTEDNTQNNTVTNTVNKDCTPAPNPSFDLAKTVSPTGTVKPGDTLNYTLTFTNTGNVALANVVIKDILPSGLTRTGDINASVTNADQPANLANLFTSGATVANVAAGGVVRITFAVTVNSDAVAATNCGANSKDLTNNSSATATYNNQNVNESNLANNSVKNTVTITKVCKSSYDVAKLVDGVRENSANPGDILTYTLTVKNTGETNLTNVKIFDHLPANITYIANSTTVNGTKVADGVTAAGGITIENLAQGATATIQFKAQVAATGAFACNTTTPLTNTVTSSTDQTSTEDNANNNSATTDVAKTCTQPKPCPTNPNLNINDKNCKPCPYNPNMNFDDKNCFKPCQYNPTISADDKNCKKPCAYNPSLTADDKNCKPANPCDNNGNGGGNLNGNTGNNQNNNQNNNQSANCNVNNNTNTNNNNNSANSSSNSNASVVINNISGSGAVTYQPMATSGSNYVPSEIVATGANQNILMLIGAGLLTFAGVAYAKSRNFAKQNR